MLSNNICESKFNEEQLNNSTKQFIEEFIKCNKKKTLNEIIEEFAEKNLGLNFNKDKDEHSCRVINFVTKYMRDENEDMSTMEKSNKINYAYYWIQPKWDIINNKKEYLIDIYKGGSAITDKRTLDYGMEMGKLSGELVKSRLPQPHDLEYEKTFWPFAILTKKRYVGNKYEFKPNEFKQDFMGIVLKRRDNAPIVKEICGGIIDQLINNRSPQGAINYTKKCLQNMFDGYYDIKYFLLSKTLKPTDSYKKDKNGIVNIAHVYLAEKIKKDDPGNAPQSGDRMDFAYIKISPKENKDKILQGEMIETPKNIMEKKLEIDYLFYLTNQIKNPALQFLELVDKDAEKIFNEFIEKYSPLKIKKEKVIKPVKEKVIKPLEHIKKLYKEINEYVKNEKWGKIETFDFDNIVKNIKKSKEIEL